MNIMQENPVGKGTGKYNGKTLFKTKPFHAGLFLACALIKDQTSSNESSVRVQKPTSSTKNNSDTVLHISESSKAKNFKTSFNEKAFRPLYDTEVYSDIFIPPKTFLSDNSLETEVKAPIEISSQKSFDERNNSKTAEFLRQNYESLERLTKSDSFSLLKYEDDPILSDSFKSLELLPQDLNFGKMYENFHTPLYSHVKVFIPGDEKLQNAILRWKGLTKHSFLYGVELVS